MDAVKQLLQTLSVGEAMQADKLTVFPLFRPGNGGVQYLTLDEALEGKVVQISEVEGGGSVPELNVINLADTMVPLVEGEQLIGANQNRTLNTSLLVAARSEMEVPVSCTEAGCWRSVSRAFGLSRAHSHP